MDGLVAELGAGTAIEIALEALARLGSSFGGGGTWCCGDEWFVVTSSC